MIDVAAVISLRNLPTVAEYGWGSIFIFGLALVGFMIPISFAAAELASGWAETGGVYVWVREAFGSKSGAVAIWADWAENLVWYPTMLSFITCCLRWLTHTRHATARPLFAAVLPIDGHTALIGGNVDLVPLDELAGRTAASLIVVYPPGIAIMVPGERFAEDSAASTSCGCSRKATTSSRLRDRDAGHLPPPRRRRPAALLHLRHQQIRNAPQEER